MDAGEIVFGLVAIALGCISWRRRKLREPPPRALPWQWGTHGWPAGMVGAWMVAAGVGLVIHGLVA